MPAASCVHVLSWLLKQVINTVGFTKSGEYIAGVCLDVMKESTEHAPGVSISGFVMDSAAANRSDMSLKALRS
jgi:hypothetical protein